MSQSVGGVAFSLRLPQQCEATWRYSKNVGLLKLAAGPSVRPVNRQQHRRMAGLRLSALRAEGIEGQLRAPCRRRVVQHAPALGSNGAAGRRSAANAGSVTLSADEGG